MTDIGKLQRYEAPPEADSDGPMRCADGMVCCDHGDYVRLDDVESVIAERDRLRAQQAAAIETVAMLKADLDATAKAVAADVVAENVALRARVADLERWKAAALDTVGSWVPRDIRYSVLNRIEHVVKGED